MKDWTPQQIVFTPIGVIHSEHIERSKTPIQPVYAHGCRGRAEILPEYEEGLQDLEGFSHIYIITYLHRNRGKPLTVTPYLQDTSRGVFATRSPDRPNSIGLSLIKLVKREGNVLYLDDVDLLDGTPILDIKPYTKRFDSRDEARDGWQANVDDDKVQQRGRRGYQPNPNRQ